MQVTNKQQIVVHKSAIQGAKVVGASNSKVQTSIGKGFGSTPAAMFKNSTKDDYDTSTLNPLQKRILSLQEQITNLNSDEKMEKDTKNNLLKPLQEELASVQEQMLKQQEDAPVTDSNLKSDSKDEATAITENTDTDKINSTENNNKSAAQQLLSWRKALAQGSDPLTVKSSSNSTIIRMNDEEYLRSQEFKDIAAQWRKEGYTDEQIYGFTHLVTAPELEMSDHIYKIKDMVKDVCNQYGFDYYERRGHEPDMEAILKKNGKAAYEAMNQAFSNFERTLWQQGSKNRQGFSDFQRGLGQQGAQNGQKVSSNHNGGFDGTIWEVLIPPSADPNKSRDPLSFIK